MEWTGGKQDDRPKRLGWAPGFYMCRCVICQGGFIGDKRAVNCADCAYADEVTLNTKHDRTT